MCACCSCERWCSTSVTWLRSASHTRRARCARCSDAATRFASLYLSRSRVQRRQIHTARRVLRCQCLARARRISDLPWCRAFTIAWHANRVTRTATATATATTTATATATVDGHTMNDARACVATRHAQWTYALSSRRCASCCSTIQARHCHRRRLSSATRPWLSASCSFHAYSAAAMTMNRRHARHVCRRDSILLCACAVRAAAWVWCPTSGTRQQHGDTATQRPTYPQCLAP